MNIDRQPLSRGRIVHAAQILALAVVYVVFGKIGLAMNLVSPFSTLVWSPAGLSLAALLIGGYRLWPGIAIGALATNLSVGAPPLSAFGIAAGNTLEAVVGAFALQRVPGFRASLGRFKDVLALTVIAGIMSTAISATVGTASLVLGGAVRAAEFAAIWGVWWAGDFIGDITVAPLLLTWARGEPVSTRPAALAEAAALGAVVIGCSVLLFAQRPEVVIESPILEPYLLFFPLLWAALRHGTRGAATATFVMSVLAIWGTYTGHGAFVRANLVASLISMNVFLVSAALASLFLGAAVAERERSQEEHRKSESLLRAIIDGTTDAVYVKDRAGRYLMVNNASGCTLGVPLEALIGRDDTALFPAAEAAMLREVDEEVMRTCRPRTYEEHLTVAGGARVYLSTKSPYRDPAGAVIGVIGISRDITERTRAERVRQSEERQRLAVEAAHLGMWFWDMKSDRLVWTPICRSMHGLGPDDEVSYARFVELLHPEDREQVEHGVRRSLADRADYWMEYRVVWPDGSLHWISALGRVFTDEAGEPERMMGAASDITAQKRAEQERADALVREQAARAEAQAATRAKDDFLAVLSHELRTPLQSMLGWTQMLSSRGLDERMARKGLSTIERNCKTQAQLIEDLLDVSRIVAGKLRLQREQVELARVVASSLESAKVEADGRSIRLDARIAPLAGVVFGDPDRLQQVVSNLLSNAVKFTPSSGHIGVRLEREGPMARIVIEDTGCGISPEFLPYVFDRFRQAESVTKRWHGGLGLGLAIVRHLVELHGGTVRAESPGEGQGATFTVMLPLVSAERAAVMVESRRPAESGSGAPAVLDGVRVLVVDDDPDTRELLETALRASGAEVRAVPSARAALEELSRFEPHLLLSDIGMPEEDGYALIREVRAREPALGSHLPAVALTAFASRADREQALSLGFDAHIAKPVTPGELAGAVARMVGRAA